MDERREQEIEIRHDSPLEPKEDNPPVPAAEEEGRKEAEVQGLREKAEELNNKYLRLYAEFENYRKLAARERQDLIKFGPEQLVYELLTVIDTLEMGLKHAGEEDQNGLRTGIEMTLKEFQRILEKFGLKPVEAAGKPFDPKYHEAMTQAERDDMEAGIVVDEFRKGYTFHDKLLRPSLVSVSRKPSSSDEIKINTQKEDEYNG